MKSDCLVCQTILSGLPNFEQELSALFHFVGEHVPLGGRAAVAHGDGGEHLIGG
jgi:hypothetical protein